jgi:hypothetical protein
MASLAQALRRLRHPKLARLLWADGLCINQHDLSEKGHQVQRMGEIFAKAENVLIWLGADPEDGQIKTAMGVMRYIIDKIPHPRHGPMTNMGPDDPMFKTLDEQMRDNEGVSDAWMALRSMYERQWRQRVWW